MYRSRWYRRQPADKKRCRKKDRFADNHLKTDNFGDISAPMNRGNIFVKDL